MENQKTNCNNLARQESNSENWVRTIAVLSPVNPIGKSLSESECQELKTGFENLLKTAHYPYFKSEGQQPEGLYTIYNIEFEQAKKYSKCYEADSFIYVKTLLDEAGDVNFTIEYWEHLCKTICGKKLITTYKLKSSQVLNGSLATVLSKEDFFSQLNPKYKTSIPFNIDVQMGAVNSTIEDYARRHPDEKIRSRFCESISESYTGEKHWKTRCELYDKWNYGDDNHSETSVIKGIKAGNSTELAEQIVETGERIKVSDIGKNIRTFAIVPEEEGALFRKPKNPILDAIKGNWPYIPVDEYFNGKRNTSFLIVNIPLDSIKKLAARYNVITFYYGYEDVMEYWQVKDIHTKSCFANDYVKKCPNTKGITNRSGLPDDYWIKGWRSRLEINIPIAAINDISTKIQANIDKYFGGDSGIVDWCLTHVGMAAHLRQKRLYQFE